MKHFVVRLAVDEREGLKVLVGKGRAPARTITRARILLRSDQGEGGECWRDEDIAAALDCSVGTCEDVRRRFIERGLEGALHHQRYQHQPRKVTGEVEAKLVALACTQPPDGRGRWTLKLLADKAVELFYIDSISDEHVRRVLKKTNSSHGLRSSG